ncbi:MAG: hypothetical protein KME05_00595 [Gloeocapsa sp. UFS-A4-WI-NPMV-4B04]|jgi:chromosome segregation ATPase|nr:hypothetical protein [Gloeocapsa sp. UFS-A4-WI-NPMV-4B04]
MVKNPLLLVSVACGVSFALSLLVNRDIKSAAIAGIITIPATFVGVFVVNGKQRIEQKQILTNLEHQIYQLEEWEAQLNHSFEAIAAEEQRTKNNINFLKIELKQLYAQITEQRSYKQQLNEDVITLEEHKNQLEADLNSLQSQVQKYEQRKKELTEFMQFMKAEKQDAEANFNLMQGQLQQLQVEINEHRNQKVELEDNLGGLNNINIELKEQLDNIQAQVQEVEKQKLEQKWSLNAIAQEKQLLEIDLELLHTQLLEQQNHKKQIENDLIILQQQKLETKPKQSEKISDEWVNFVMRLNKPEIQVLKAIIEQSDPSAAIKKIAEENITMPELLIDAINECALDTIGDLIIEPGSELVPMGILEEYLENLNKVININEID